MLTKNQIELSKLKDRYKNKRAFVIGNGPSLRYIDFSKLKNEITIASNGIFLLFDKLNFYPTFYTVEDCLVAEDRSSIINKLNCSQKIIPYDLKYCLSQENGTIYINFIRDHNKFPQFSLNFQEIVFWGGTVTYLNLELAYYLGIKEVYLIGVDHNYKSPSKSDIINECVITSNSLDLNHFDPGYFGPGYRYHDPMLHRMEIAYHEAKKIFEKHNRKIFNAGVGGKLEIFERVNFDALF